MPGERSARTHKRKRRAWPGATDTR